jgi:hypothetical protein
MTFEDYLTQRFIEDGGNDMDMLPDWLDNLPSENWAELAEKWHEREMKNVTIKEEELKHSYICRVLEEIDGSWWVEIIGINGKVVFQTEYYKKRSLALNMARSFCIRVSGVRLDVLASEMESLK